MYILDGLRVRSFSENFYFGWTILLRQRIWKLSFVYLVVFLSVFVLGQRNLTCQWLFKTAWWHWICSCKMNSMRLWPDLRAGKTACVFHNKSLTCCLLFLCEVLGLEHLWNFRPQNTMRLYYLFYFLLVCLGVRQRNIGLYHLIISLNHCSYSLLNLMKYLNCFVSGFIH